MKTLAVIAGESAKRTTHFLTMEQPTEAEWPTQMGKCKRAGMSPANTVHSNCIDTPESECHVTKRAGMATACTTTGRERPALIPPSQDWFYLGPWDMPQVRQVEVTQRPPGTYTDPSNNDNPSMKNIIDRPVFITTDRNWCYLGSRDAPSVRQVEIIQRPPGTYIGPFNDEDSPTENIADQSEDHNWRRKKGNLHRNEVAVFEKNWPKPKTKDKHGAYINKQSHHDRSVVHQTSRRADGHQIVNNMDNSTRLRLQARHLPEWIEIRDVLDEEPQRPPYQGPGVFEAPWRPPPEQTIPPSPTNDILIRRATATPTPAPTYRTPGVQLPSVREMQDSLNDEQLAQYPPPIKDETLEEMRRTQYPTTTRENLRRSPSSSPEALSGPRPLTDITNAAGHNDGQNSFRDILEDEPVLSVGNLNIRDESDENSDICRECKDGSRFWCPIRESPKTNKRGPRSRHLDRCGSCGKLYVIHGASRQWCCHDWVSRSSRSPPLDR